MSAVEVYSVGLCATSVCAPAALTPEQVEQEVNSISPTGLSSRWKIAHGDRFKGGEPMPNPCESNPDRQHWLLLC